ncbi:glycoside hydrolase family 16 protein [Pontibacter sp. E15-1]|uniref:glycoside hydrolase family 16 protein n=1 Tax=Pontibacter sp. E15-1 TaxID=2919918 RepID=UPI001F4F8C44|nr:glycoside hydrolase family 16 protein [Pontibacter sp. E15-1]MCJ8164298.1 glycoside hydrolase family 16 protein [Pontibacter sp. E15-1]
MKTRGLYFFGLLCCLSLSQCQTVSVGNKGETSGQVPQMEGYKLVWSDEFDVDGKPDSAFWSYEEGLVRNNELQYYQADNATVKNGLLVIEGRREKVWNKAYKPGSSDWRKRQEYAGYSSSSIHTRGKKEFQYGIVEVRAKVDTASGMWPAIWTLGITRPWPANGEIDMMEYYIVDGTPSILANMAWKEGANGVAWDSEKIPLTKFLAKDPDWPNKFHVWKMDWTEDYIKLYLDEELLNQVNLRDTKNPDSSNGFLQPHYLLLNLAIGAKGGEPAKTPFPKIYEVDYVRVYQKVKGRTGDTTMVE